MAKNAAKRFAQSSDEQKNLAIHLISESLLKNAEKIIAANNKDVDAARKRNIAEPMIDRLLLNNERIDAMASSLGEIIKIKDPREYYQKIIIHNNLKTYEDYLK